eukprot:SAG22_NODE_627_length_8410_cov_9.212249_7_plen_141_part_00
MDVWHRGTDWELGKWENVSSAAARLRATGQTPCEGCGFRVAAYGIPGELARWCRRCRDRDHPDGVLDTALIEASMQSTDSGGSDSEAGDDSDAGDSAAAADSDKTKGNHMMSPDFIWFHPGAVSVLTYGTFGGSIEVLCS